MYQQIYLELFTLVGGRPAAMSDGFRGRCAGTALFPHWISCKLWKLC